MLKAYIFFKEDVKICIEINLVPLVIKTSTHFVRLRCKRELWCLSGRFSRNWNVSQWKRRSILPLTQMEPEILCFRPSARSSGKKTIVWKVLQITDRKGKVMFSRVSVCPQSASWLLAHCSTLRHGRYASYWNAFCILFSLRRNSMTFCLTIPVFLLLPPVPST